MLLPLGRRQLYLAAQYACTVAAQHAEFSSSSPSGPVPRSKISQNLQRRLCPGACAVAGSIIHTTASSRSACNAAPQRVRMCGSARAPARAPKPKRNCRARLLTCTPTSIPRCPVRALLLLRCCSDSLVSLGRVPPHRLPSCTERRAAWTPCCGPASPAPLQRFNRIPPVARRCCGLCYIQTSSGQPPCAHAPARAARACGSPGPLHASDLRMRHAVLPGEQPGVCSTLDDFKLESERAPARPVMHILQNRPATASYAHSRQALPAPLL